MSTLQEDADRARINRSKPGGDQSNNNDYQDEGDDQENAGDILNAAAAKLENQANDGADGVINEGIEGVSSKKFLMEEAKNSLSELNNSDYNKYQGGKDGSADGQDDDKRDDTTKKRESFLSIYKENQDGNGE